MSFELDPAIAEQVAALQAKFRARAEKLDSDTKKAVNTCCLKVERDWKASMTPNGPSAPGEPPAVVTGRFRAAITHRVETESGEVAGYVGAPVKYFGDPDYDFAGLEFGTSKMAARPSAGPALEKNRVWIKEKLKSVVKDPGSVGSAE